MNLKLVTISYNIKIDQKKIKRKEGFLRSAFDYKIKDCYLTTFPDLFGHKKIGVT